MRWTLQTRDGEQEFFGWFDAGLPGALIENGMTAWGLAVHKMQGQVEALSMPRVSVDRSRGIKPHVRVGWRAEGGSYASYELEIMSGYVGAPSRMRALSDHLAAHMTTSIKSNIKRAMHNVSVGNEACAIDCIYEAFSESGGCDIVPWEHIRKIIKRQPGLIAMLLP